MNAADLLLRGAPTAEAIVSREETLSYAGLRNRVARSAFLWQRYGLRPGKRCVIGLVDGADWVAPSSALIWMGGIPVAISPSTDIALIRELIVDAGAIALLLEDETAAAVARCPRPRSRRLAAPAGKDRRGGAVA
jgi:non-ribosomal peptide synthetase component E (peptide arylation enzyme)